MQAAEQTVLEIPLPPFVPKEEARLMLAAKLLETGRLSLGQATKMAGMTKRGFLEALSRLGVSVVDYPAAELAEEIAW